MTGLEHVRFADEELIKTQVLKGEAAQTIIRGENCSVYKMENETGEGVITRYPVFPGIELLYDDIHMSCGVAHREDPRADLLEINQPSQWIFRWRTGFCVRCRRRWAKGCTATFLPCGTGCVPTTPASLCGRLTPFSIYSLSYTMRRRICGPVISNSR